MNAYPSYVSEEKLRDLIGRALAEDVGGGDVTTEATVRSGTPAEARFLAKEDGVLAGQRVAELVMQHVDASLSCSWTRRDGETVYKGTAFGTVRGEAASILTAERLTLNLMQRMSGIATETHRYVDAVRRHGARILDTRKTAPGLRLLDKWAVRLGGGENHRIGLFDMILIKDNHIAAAGNIAAALKHARRYAESRNLKIEIETRSADEVDEVLAEEGVDIILLDNMVDLRPDDTVDVSRLREAVKRINGRITTEASGNVTLQTVEAIAATGVDYISTGALTHSVRALDISLQMKLVAR